MEKEKDFFKNLSTLHAAMLIGQVLIVGFLYYLSYGDVAEENKTFEYLVVLIGISGLGMGLFSSKQMIEKAKKQPHLSLKLHQYRVASILKWAMIEGPVLVATIAHYVTGSKTSLIISFALLAYFALSKPTKEKLVTELELNRAEENQI